MRTRHPVLATIGCALVLVTGSVAAIAGEIIVTPSDPQGWAEANARGGGVSVISGVQPRSGTGSLDQFLLDNGNGGANNSKTDYEIFSPDTTFVDGEGLKATSGGFGLLTDLSTLLFDWYRDSSSTAPGHLTPAMRLWLWDPDAGGANGTSYFVIWEGVYNDYPASGGPVPTDTWTTEEEMADDFFWRIPQFEDGVFRGISWCNSNPTECFVFDNTLGDWGFGANTVVFGINTGLGSGWAGSYQGYTDNVTIGFSEPTVWNFELDQLPSATVIGLVAIFVLLAGALLWRTRRRGATA